MVTIARLAKVSALGCRRSRVQRLSNAGGLRCESQPSGKCYWPAINGSWCSILLGIFSTVQQPLSHRGLSIARLRLAITNRRKTERVADPSTQSRWRNKHPVLMVRRPPELHMGRPVSGLDRTPASMSRSGVRTPRPIWGAPLWMRNAIPHTSMENRVLLLEDVSLHVRPAISLLYMMTQLQVKRIDNTLQ